MKKLSVNVIVLVVVLTLVSCGKQRQTQTLKEMERKYIAPAEMVLTANDTTEVRTMVEHFLSLLKDGNSDDAVDMLYYLRGDSVVKLPDDLAALQRSMYRRIHGVRYEIERLTFLTEKDSEVKYKVILFERKENDTRPNEISGFLKPVRRDGTWFLTLADDMTDSNNSSRIKD